MAEISALSEGVITEIQAGVACREFTRRWRFRTQSAALASKGFVKKIPPIQEESNFEVPYLIGSHWCSSSIIALQVRSRVNDLKVSPH